MGASMREHEYRGDTERGEPDNSILEALPDPLEVILHGGGAQVHLSGDLGNTFLFPETQVVDLFELGRKFFELFIEYRFMMPQGRFG